MAGALAVIAEINEKRATAVSEEIMKDGGEALAVTTDVADPASIDEMIEVVEDQYGRIDVLINNAGIFSTLEMRPFDQIPLEEWDRVLRVNLTGPFLCARAVLPAMRRARWGRIINVASGAVRLGRPNYLHYIATKGGTGRDEPVDGARARRRRHHRERHPAGRNLYRDRAQNGDAGAKGAHHWDAVHPTRRDSGRPCGSCAVSGLGSICLCHWSEYQSRWRRDRIMSGTPIVAIVAPGNMGAGIGRRLTENKVTVLTSLAGRSEESAKRAREAGIQPVEEHALAEADFLLSIIPPGDALDLARRLAPVLTASNRKLIYVECNAVSPATMQKIAKEIAATGCPFVGAGIIGPPPKPGSANTKIYASGPAAADLARLNDYGLIVRVLDGPVTAASALKMSYAGITKGFTALGATMMLAATRGGSAEALRNELAESRPDLLRYLSNQIPSMYSKAYRWVAELDEIASFIGDERAEHEMLVAAARLYERIADDFEKDKSEIGALARFLNKS